MAFTGTTLTDAFKQHLLEGVHDFRPGGGVFKLALYTEEATLDAATSAYTDTHEIAASAAYTAGGLILVSTGVLVDSHRGYVGFQNAVFSGALTQARGALIYNSAPTHSYTNPTVAVLDFGATRTSQSGVFTVQFPATNADTAIIQIR